VIRLDEGVRDLTLQAPREALKQVLRGLLANACEASPAGEPVELHASGDGASCRIEICRRGWAPASASCSSGRCPTASWAATSSWSI